MTVLLLVLLVAVLAAAMTVVDASMLRHGEKTVSPEEIRRELQKRNVVECDGPDAPPFQQWADEIWGDPTLAAMIYQACIDQSSTRTEPCAPASELEGIVAGIPAKDKGCSSNDDCTGTDEVCWVHTGSSICAPSTATESEVGARKYFCESNGNIGT